MPTGGEIKKYTLWLLSIVFEEAEMKNGIIGPIGKKWRTARFELDNERVQMIKGIEFTVNVT